MGLSNTIFQGCGRSRRCASNLAGTWSRRNNPVDLLNHAAVAEATLGGDADESLGQAIAGAGAEPREIPQEDVPGSQALEQAARRHPHAFEIKQEVVRRAR